MDSITVLSRNGVLIRLTTERWKHICLMHPALADKQDLVLDTVHDPNFVFNGSGGEFLAVSMASKRSYLVVVYMESESDGFIITAFETTDKRWLFRKELIWSKHL